MTNEKEISEHLHRADAELRLAMVKSAKIGLSLVVPEIRESQFKIDDALTWLNYMTKKNCKKILTKSKKSVKCAA